MCFVLFVILIGYKSIQTENIPINEIQTEKTPEIIQAEKLLEISLNDLTKKQKQKQKLNRNLLPKVREILDNAETLEIFADFNKETKEFQIVGGLKPPNTVAKISDKSLKNSILESFYFDTAVSDGGAAGCFYPRHTIKATHKGKTVEIIICYQCNSYKGSSSFGEIYGTLNYDESKSEKLLNYAVEKYGVDVQ